MSQTHTTNQQSSQQGILDFCESSYQVDPLTLRRIFLLLTRNHFAQPSYFGNVPPSFKDLFYDDDLKKTKVRIELDYNYDWETSHVPNGIFVGVGDVVTTKNVLDSYAQATEERSGREYVDSDKVRVTISHVSKSPDASLQMGIISKGFYQGMRQLIKQRLGLRGYQVVGLSEPKPIKKGDEIKYYRTDLVIELLINSAWVTLLESHRIKKININLV